MKSTTLHEYERETGDDQAQNDYWAQTRRSILEDWVAEVAPDSLLDVGCGSGYLADYLGTNSSFVAGIDIDQDSITLAARRSNVDSAIVGDAVTLPYPADTFDCILLGDVLEHFEDPQSVLDECHRALVRDGVLVISVPAFRWLSGPHDEHNNHADRYNASRLSAVVGDVGFKIDDYRYSNFFPLPAYFVTQRILKCGVPSSARGSHNTLVEWIKQRLVSLEEDVRFPIGITLLATCSMDQ
jgi:SAM-dependent methyltransferase